ncbi:MAG: methylthioribulose 1-phosphate dehydratase [Bdellovibrionales bacterium]|nr:methylthioribulose 1-phosphate dehydratase [Bdellovibrionales bacterium]
MDERLALIAIANRISHAGWSPATGGNFSVRSEDSSYWITRSGVDKGNLDPSHFLLCHVQTGLPDGDGKPSDENHLHALLYQMEPRISCVLHTHSVPGTVLSRYFGELGEVPFCGWEMQKALSGCIDPEESLPLPIFSNSQNMKEIEQSVRSRFQVAVKSHSFLLKGHGLYVWGESIPQAWRHLEGIEFLLSCLLQETLLEGR